MRWRNPASSTREIAGDALKALPTVCRVQKGLNGCGAFTELLKHEGAEQLFVAC